MAEYDDRLSLAAYPFPEINRGDMVCATIETDPILLEEAKNRGFYMKDTPANRMFNELFNNVIHSDRIVVDELVCYILIFHLFQPIVLPESAPSRRPASTLAFGLRESTCRPKTGVCPGQPAV